MDALEQKVTKSLQKSGWCTEIREGEEMVRYKPRAKKMIYGKLFHLCHNHDVDKVLNHKYSQ